MFHSIGSTAQWQPLCEPVSHSSFDLVPKSDASSEETKRQKSSMIKITFLLSFSWDFFTPLVLKSERSPQNVPGEEGA